MKEKKKKVKNSHIYMGGDPASKDVQRTIGNCASRGLTRVKALEVVPHTCKGIGSCASHV